MEEEKTNMRSTGIFDMLNGNPKNIIEGIYCIRNQQAFNNMTET